MTDRIENLLSKLPQEIDAALITSSPNRFYFTGMQSSAGTLLAVRGGNAYFIIDSRYVEKARACTHGCEVLLQGKLYEQLTELLARHKVHSLAIEGDYMTVAEFEQMKARLNGVTLVSDEQVNSAVRGMRARKSPEEIAAIRAAQKITDDAFAHICGYIRIGMTDREIAGELLDFTYRHGSERPAFDYIVVSGTHSSMPHGVPTGKRVERGDFITMDFGCVVDGYCSDMTRTVAVGEASAEMRKVYDTVLRANEAALAAVRPGAVCADVDAAARDLIAQAGWGSCFGHSTGHSLGIEIHEKPGFAGSDGTVCTAGMLITVEPGIYLEGRFGVRIEDMALITESGYENLTHSRKDLVVISSEIE